MTASRCEYDRAGSIFITHRALRFGGLPMYLSGGRWPAFQVAFYP